jgi:hypothetical protein
MTILRARPSAPPSPGPRAALRSAPNARPPVFLVGWQGAFSGWWDSLKALGVSVPLQSLKASITLFRDTPVTPFRFPGGSLTGSLFLHFVALLILPFLLSLPPGRDITSVAAYSESPKIYYRLTTRDPFARLPRISPAGLGGRPGAGSAQLKLPVLGSTAPHRQIIVISKPVHPDNHHQTIYQPASPPDLKITMDLKLPNVIGGTKAAVPKPQIHFNPNSSKPLQSRREIAKATAPALASGSAAPMNLPDPSISQPHLAVPVNPNSSKPLQSRREIAKATAPALASGSAAPMNLPDPSISQPHLAVPVNPNSSRPNQWQGVISAAAAPSLASANASTSMNLSDFGTSQTNGPSAPVSTGTGISDSNANTSETGAPAAGDGSGVVIIGVDPSDEASLANLPAGNRWGDFSIAPGGGQPGSAGGKTGGSTIAGAGTSGSGGDRSVGVGPSDSGGGGGKAGPNGTLSITGSPGGTGEAMLDPSIVRDMVFAVPSTLTLRRNALIVSAGPMGGGGLDAYGALHCGKIYTVFLSMPGKGWTLQFCQSGNAAGKPPVQAHSSVVHLEQGLLPPDVESRFDFKRLPVPFEKKNKLIVLKGVIKEDGTVDDLKIYQSIVPEMDEAARVAFSRWKFKPALKEGKPVAVDILVGIPPEALAGRSQ